MLVTVPYQPRSPPQARKRDLSDLQTKLVDILIGAEDTGGTSLAQAAVDAGYKGGREPARVSATKALQQPHVRSYFQDRIQEILIVGAPAALKTLTSKFPGNLFSAIIANFQTSLNADNLHSCQNWCTYYLINQKNKY